MDSFGSRGTLVVGDASYEIFRLDAVPGAERLPFCLKVLLENLLRTEDGANVTADHDPRARRAGTRWPSRDRDPVHPGPCAHAGLHRRAVRRRPRRDARGDGRPRRRPVEDQPAEPGRAGHRPLRHRRRLRPRGRLRAQRRAGVRAQRGALPVPALGPVARSPTSRSCRPTPASSTRSISSTWPAWSSPTGGRATVAYPDTLVGTDSHTTMVNGLAVLGWGVGGIEAEAAMLGQPVSMLIPRGRRLQAVRRAARGRDRDRPGADRHRDAAQARRRRQVRRVLRPGRGQRAAGEPRHHRQHEPRVRLDRCHLPDRRRDAALPAFHRSRARAGRAGRGLRQGAGPVARPGRRAGLLRDASSSTSATIVPSLAGPKRPQDRVAVSDAKSAFRRAGARLRG